MSPDNKTYLAIYSEISDTEVGTYDWTKSASDPKKDMTHENIYRMESIRTTERTVFVYLYCTYCRSGPRHFGSIPFRKKMKKRKKKKRGEKVEVGGDTQRCSPNLWSDISFYLFRLWFDCYSDLFWMEVEVEEEMERDAQHNKKRRKTTRIEWRGEASRSNDNGTRIIRDDWKTIK